MAVILAQIRMQYAGAIGLLCELAVYVGNGTDGEERREQIECAVQDWCKLTGWKMRRTINRIEVEP